MSVSEMEGATPAAVGVWLISGVPAAGKTTASRLLAAEFDRSAHIEGDVVGQQFIVSGLVPPQGPRMEEADRQLELRRRNICLLADSFAEAGFIPVIDDVVVSDSVLDLYGQLLQTRPLRLIQLVPSLDVIRARDAGRSKHVFELWGHLHDEHQRMRRLGFWLDTSDLTGGETVQAILANRDAAVISIP